MCVCLWELKTPMGVEVKSMHSVIFLSGDYKEYMCVCVWVCVCEYPSSYTRVSPSSCIQGHYYHYHRDTHTQTHTHTHTHTARILNSLLTPAKRAEDSLQFPTSIASHTHTHTHTQHTHTHATRPTHSRSSR